MEHIKIILFFSNGGTDTSKVQHNTGELVLKREDRVNWNVKFVELCKVLLDISDDYYTGSRPQTCFYILFSISSLIQWNKIIFILLFKYLLTFSERELLMLIAKKLFLYNSIQVCFHVWGWGGSSPVQTFSLYL